MRGSLPETIPDRVRLGRDYERRKEAYSALLEELEKVLAKALRSAGMHPTIKGRVKDFDSLYKKRIRILRKALSEGRSPIPINDIIGIRVVFPFLGDLAHAESVISSAMKVVEIERKGAERSYREFGYESVHLLVEIPEPLRLGRTESDLSFFEIQLRTILQEAWAEVEHELVYKAEFTPFDDPMKRKLAALNANLALSDIIFQEIRDYQRRMSSELDKRRREFYAKVEETMDSPLSGREGAPRSAAPTEEASPELGPEAPAERSRLEDREFATIDDLLLEALYAHNKKNYRRAIAVYGAILEKHPSKEAAAIVYKHRGMAYFAESRYEEAVEDFTKTLDMDHDSYRAAYYRGVVRSVQGDYAKAIADFDLSLALNPYQFFALYRRAQAYFHLDDAPKCLADCEAAMKLQPENVHALRLKAMALDKLHM